ncbi:MAG: LPO_1073/Vpar_1526 family protein [Chloroflexota bacterium]
MTLPTDPYALKAVETATKTIIELLHQDVKSGVTELLNLIKERGKEKAIENARNFEQVLEKDMAQRISIGISPNGYERIEGNLNDPDFAYLVRQATIASARTSSPDKHALLARAVTERLIAQPEGLVALASSLACEIIPNLTQLQLSFLGLLTTVMGIRPTITFDVSQASAEIQQDVYLSWLKKTLTVFSPFPKMRPIDYDHLQGMSCIDVMRIGQRDWHSLLKPRDLPKFAWPEGFFEKDELILELKKIDGLLKCATTTVGAVIGTHVHDIKSNANPTVFLWDNTE